MSALQDGDAVTALPQRRSNRPVTLRHRAEYLLVLGLFFLFRLTGLKYGPALAGAVTGFAGPRIRSLSKRAEDNLRVSFPDWTEEQIAETVKDVWVNLGKFGAEFSHLEKFIPYTKNSRVSVSGSDRLRAIARKDRPAILVSGHFANWEVMSIVFHHTGLPYSLVYRPANNPLVDELIIHRRAEVMTRHQIPKGKKGARNLVSSLAAGRSLAMLMDQKLNDGISVPFMGRQAMTAPAAARLARKFGLAVIPVSITREKDSRFHVTVHEPLEAGTGDGSREDIHALTEGINRFLESCIRNRPGEWLWLHRRWPRKKQ